MTDLDKKLQELRRALQESQDANWVLAGRVHELEERNQQLNEIIVKADALLENILNYLKEQDNENKVQTKVQSGKCDDK